MERPASVVKELVENAIDAGADTVEVHLEDGGLGRIVVSDDGCGMSAADAARAPLRHATSKLRSAAELARVATLGFRGEALSSIASVSEFTLTTRRREDVVGVRVQLIGGAKTRIEEVGAPVGTTVDVRGLFFNTPARRKFMRSPATEQAHACEAALRVVLGARRGSLLVEASGRRLIDIAPRADTATRARAALGAKVGTVYPFDDDRDGVRVSGVIARPDYHRVDGRQLFFFVNGRFVRDRLLQRAVLDGCRAVLEPGRYPAALIYIDIERELVDVNVHPQKLEVRFGESELVFSRVSRSIASVLGSSPWLRKEGLFGPLPSSARPQRRVEARPSLPLDFVAAAREAGRIAGGGEVEPARHEVEVGESLVVRARGELSRLRPIGQALGTYLICEGEEELVLIDQHAAHERVLFHALMKEREGGEILRQALLLPEPVELRAPQAEAFGERWQDLLAFGVEIEPVGPGRFVVRALPARLAHADAHRLALDLIDEVCALEEEGLALATRQAKTRLLARAACHAAVRAGDVLSNPEITALLLALDECEHAGACPHGRPVVYRLARQELARRFGRR